MRKKLLIAPLRRLRYVTRDKNNMCNVLYPPPLYFKAHVRGTGASGEAVSLLRARGSILDLDVGSLGGDTCSVGDQVNSH